MSPFAKPHAIRGIRLSRLAGHDPRAPRVSAQREQDVSPAPTTPIADQVAEMIANDEEWQEWRAAEARAGWSAKGHRR